MPIEIGVGPWLLLVLVLGCTHELVHIRKPRFVIVLSSHVASIVFKAIISRLLVGGLFTKGV